MENVGSFILIQFASYTLTVVSAEKKEWFERGKCINIRVFNNITETEIAALHSEDCIEKNICTTCTEDFEKTGSFKTLMVSPILRPKTTLQTKQ